MTFFLKCGARIYKKNVSGKKCVKTWLTSIKDASEQIINQD